MGWMGWHWVVPWIYLHQDLVFGYCVLDVPETVYTNVNDWKMRYRQLQVSLRKSEQI